MDVNLTAADFTLVPTGTSTTVPNVDKSEYIVRSYADHANPIILKINSQVNDGFAGFRVMVTDINGISTYKDVGVVIGRTEYHTISKKETQAEYDTVAALNLNITDNLYSLYSETFQGSTFIEYERHLIENSTAVKDSFIKDDNGKVTFTELVASSPLSVEVENVVDAANTTNLYAAHGMNFTFSGNASSQEVYVKFPATELHIDFTVIDPATAQTLSYSTIENFMAVIADNNQTYGLARSYDGTKVLMIDKTQDYINLSTGNLVEYDQNATETNSSAGTWEKISLNGYTGIALDPANNVEYRQDEAYVIDGGVVKHASYVRANEIFSYVLLNKDAKDQLYYTLSPNPKIDVELNNGYTYISNPTDDWFCDSAVATATNYSQCDTDNNLSTIFASNPNIETLYKFGSEWMFWSPDGNTTKLRAPYFSVITPTDGILVKTTAGTTVALPFDEDSVAVNTYINLPPTAWILKSNNKEQTVAEIATALSAQVKSIVYILLLRDNVWHVYAPNYSGTIDGATRMDTTSVVKRYESYWLQYQ